MVLALHEVLLGHRHVVAQIVEAELVVGTEGDIACISLSAGVAVRLVLVDAVYAEAMEHIERAHPLGVSLGEVVVHCYHMHSLAGQCVKEHRKGRHEGLSFSCSHLGYLSLMEDDTSYELNIIVDHVPCDFVSAGHPMVLPYCIVAVYGHKFLGCAEIAVKVCRLYADLRVLSEAACR